MKKKSERGSGRKICVSIAGDTVEEAIRAAGVVESLADVIEIRLDGLAHPDVAPFMAALKTPLLFTNRPEWEGGFWSGDEEDRINLLLEAIHAGAQYVDLELMSDISLKKKVLDAAAKKKTQVVLSWHSFKTTPSSQGLQDILQQQFRSGAQAGKIVTMAHNFSDVLRVLELQVQAKEIGFPLVAFCMGRAGMISRLATLEMGGFMTYAAPDSGSETAPGQLTVSAIRSMLKNFPETK